MFMLGLCFFQDVICFASLLTRTFNTDWNKLAETMQKSSSEYWPNEFLHQVSLCKSVLEVCMMQSALLQDTCSINIPLLFGLAASS